MLLLVSIAAVASKNFNVGFAWFIYAFAIWDIFYYFFLYVFLGWPENLLTLGCSISFAFYLGWPGDSTHYQFNMHDFIGFGDNQVLAN